MVKYNVISTISINVRRGKPAIVAWLGYKKMFEAKYKKRSETDENFNLVFDYSNQQIRIEELDVPYSYAKKYIIPDTKMDLTEEIEKIEEKKGKGVKGGLLTQALNQKHIKKGTELIKEGAGAFKNPFKFAGVSWDIKTVIVE